MATVMETCCIEQIGEKAGEVWHYLAGNGPVTLAKLCKAVGGPRDVVMQAVGWLAREDKIEIDESNRSRTIRLK